MSKIYFYFIVIFLTVFSFSQENTETANISNQQNIAPPAVPEIGTLRQKYATSSLSPKELFTLASFYLSKQLYHQAIELYSDFLNNKDEFSKDQPNINQIANAHYNKALALFSLNLYDSALDEFQNAYQLNNNLYNSLRMIGTIYFQKTDKNNALQYWNEYLIVNTTPSIERASIENAVKILSNPDFEFETDKKEPKEEKSWPFLNPDIIPNPDSKYDKKRVI